MFKNYLKLAVCAIAFCLFYGCKDEGCTDPQALNYNAIADEDDGSCLYCDEAIVDTLALITETLEETRFNSSQFLEPVFEIEIFQTNQTGSFANCPATENLCRTEVTLKNISDFEMENFSMSVTLSSPFVFRSLFFNNINLESGQDSLVYIEEQDLNFFVCAPFTDVEISHDINFGDYLE